MLDRLKQQNIGINFEKSQFGKNEVSFLGQNVSSEYVNAITGDLDTLTKIEPPINKKDEQKIVGSWNGSVSFIPDIQRLIASLTRILKQKKVQMGQGTWKNSKWGS